MIDYNMAIERELPGSILLNVAYAGSRGLNLWQPVSEMNPDCPTSYAFVPQGCPIGPTPQYPNFPGTTVIPGFAPGLGHEACQHSTFEPILLKFFSIQFLGRLLV